MTVKEFLEQKEEITQEVVPIKYSELTKKLFEMVYCSSGGGGVVCEGGGVGLS